MEKIINTRVSGHKVTMGAGFSVCRVLPNRYIPKVGPFVFLDHIGPVQQKPNPNLSAPETLYSVAKFIIIISQLSYHSYIHASAIDT